MSKLRARGLISLKADSHIACRSHAVPLPCRADMGLEYVFPIWFTQCGRVWFTLAMPRPCHAPTMPFFSRPQHSTAVSRQPCCAVVLRRTAWSKHGMGMALESVNQTRPHCVNQMGKAHSKPLAARHGRKRHGRRKGTACFVWIGLKEFHLRARSQFLIFKSFSVK